MPDFVLDANVFIADLQRSTVGNQRERARPYLNQVRHGSALAHVPSLMVIEVCGALARKISVNIAVVARRRLKELAQHGRLVVYELDVARTNRATDVAIRYRLKGADATYAGLSEELGVDLVTFDEASLATPLRNGGYTHVVVPP